MRGGTCGNSALRKMHEGHLSWPVVPSASGATGLLPVRLTRPFTRPLRSGVPEEQGAGGDVAGAHDPDDDDVVVEGRVVIVDGGLAEPDEATVHYGANEEKPRAEARVEFHPGRGEFGPSDAVRFPQLRAADEEAAQCAVPMIKPTTPKFGFDKFVLGGAPGLKPIDPTT